MSVTAEAGAAASLANNGQILNLPKVIKTGLILMALLMAPPATFASLRK